MDPFQKTLGALRAVTHEGPRHQGWRRALSLMGQLRQADQQQVALDYLRGAVEGWPEPLRLLSAQDWRKARHRDAPHPIWPLVLSAHLPSCQAQDLRRLQAWCAQHPIHHLRLHLDRGTKDIELLTAPVLRENLRSLRLRSSTLHHEGVAVLLGQPWPLLEVLDLTGNWWSGQDLAALLERLPRLRELHLDLNPISLAHLRDLAQRGHPRLELLSLRQNPQMRASLLPELERASGEGKPLPRLRQVSVELTAVDQRDTTADTWALWRRWQQPAAAQLTLDRDVSLQGVQQALLAGHLDQVEELTLQSPQMGGEALRTLCSSPRLERLRQLKLSYTGELTQERRQWLEGAPWAAQLRALTLESLPGVEAATLLRAPSLRGLEALGLPSCQLSTGEVVRLARASPSSSLRALNLQKIKLDRAAVQALVDSPWCQRLQVCQVSYHSLAPSSVHLARGFAPMLPPRAGRWPLAWRRALTPPQEQMSAELRHFGRQHQVLVPFLEHRCPAQLSFYWARLDRAALLALARARLVGVKALSFTHQEFPPGTLEALLNAPWARGLEELSLGSCNLQAGDIEQLARWRPHQLKRLSLYHNHALDLAQTRQVLQEAPWAASLEALVTA